MNNNNIKASNVTILKTLGIVVGCMVIFFFLLTFYYNRRYQQAGTYSQPLDVDLVKRDLTDLIKSMSTDFSNYKTTTNQSLNDYNQSLDKVSNIARLGLLPYGDWKYKCSDLSYDGKLIRGSCQKSAGVNVVGAF